MTGPDLNVIFKGAVASSVIFFSASTTAALHWFISLYVHKLVWQPHSDSFEVEMMSWLATYTPRTIKFADIQPPQTNRPYVTFKANGNFCFVDAEHCHNKALLAKLTPHKPAHESAFKNLLREGYGDRSPRFPQQEWRKLVQPNWFVLTLDWLVNIFFLPDG
uniref:Uncharacterized protein n=1 Tax=Rhizophora mucronata TaxID=61149 RepID=A0A2P2NHR4_RHIMU